MVTSRLLPQPVGTFLMEDFSTLHLGVNSISADSGWVSPFSLYRIVITYKAMGIKTFPAPLCNRAGAGWNPLEMLPSPSDPPH